MKKAGPLLKNFAKKFLFSLMCCSIISLSAINMALLVCRRLFWLTRRASLVERPLARKIGIVPPGRLKSIVFFFKVTKNAHFPCSTEWNQSSDLFLGESEAPQI